MADNTAKSAVIAAVVALVIGGGIGYSLGDMDTTTTSMSSQTNQSEMIELTDPAVNLRVGMNNLLREHVSSSLDVTRNIADEVPENELNGSIAAQMANAGEIAAAVGSVYGQDAQTQITEMFVEHIEESNNYARAVAAGDEEAKQVALVELNEYLEEISTFFSTAIDDLPQEAVYGLLEEHEGLLNDSVEAYESGDFARSYELEREALTQVSTIADALTGGIVATKSDMF